MMNRNSKTNTQNNPLLQLIHRSFCRPRDEEKGAGFLLGMCLGILMFFGGLLALHSGSREKTNAISGESQAKAMAVAESAVGRYIDLLLQNPQIAVFCANPSTNPSSCNTGTTWSNMNSDPLASLVSPLCLPSSTSTMTTAQIADVQAAASTDWQTYNTNGQYKLISYTYKSDTGTGNEVPGTATLIMESENIGSTGVATRLEVLIPITPSCLIPGVWAQAGGTVKVAPHSNGSINAVVTRTGSAPPLGDFPANSLNGSTIYDGTTAPSSGDITTAMPPPPPNIPGPNYTIFSVGDATTGYLDLSACTIRLPRKSGVENAWGSGCNDPIKMAFNGGTVAGSVLATGDVAAADNRYHYLIPSSAPVGNSIILANAAILIEPDAGKKVVLYVRGDITMSGTGSNGTSSPTVSLATTGSRDSDPNASPNYGCELTADTGTAAVTTFINQGSPANLEMYGADGSAFPNWSSGHTANVVNMAGNTRINGFMLFPAAEVRVSQGLISGSVWARTFDFSNTAGCTVGVVQNSVGNVLAANVTNTPTNIINPITSWRRLSR